MLSTINQWSIQHVGPLAWFKKAISTCHRCLSYSKSTSLSTHHTSCHGRIYIHIWYINIYIYIYIYIWFYFLQIYILYLSIIHIDYYVLYRYVSIYIYIRIPTVNCRPVNSSRIGSSWVWFDISLSFPVPKRRTGDWRDWPGSSHRKDPQGGRRSTTGYTTLGKTSGTSKMRSRMLQLVASRLEIHWNLWI